MLSKEEVINAIDLMEYVMGDTHTGDALLYMLVCQYVVFSCFFSCWLWFLVKYLVWTYFVIVIISFPRSEINLGLQFICICRLVGASFGSNFIRCNFWTFFTQAISTFWPANFTRGGQNASYLTLKPHVMGTSNLKCWFVFVLLERLFWVW